MKRIPMSLNLQEQSFKHERPCRTVRTSDSDDLAILLYAAFRGTIDDEGEPFSAAVREIEKTMAGDYGRLIPECSFVIESGAFIAESGSKDAFGHAQLGGAGEVIAGLVSNKLKLKLVLQKRMRLSLMKLKLKNKS